MSLTGGRRSRISRPAGRQTVHPKHHPGPVVTSAEETERVAVHYIFNSFVRGSHWIRALLMIWFVVSGLYLAVPYLARDAGTDTAFNFIQAQIRGWHVMAGWVLLGLTLVRMYVFFLLRQPHRPGDHHRLGVGDEVRMARILFDLRAWREQLSYYLLLRRRHPSQGYSSYGPLQYLVYVGFYVALVMIILTGIILAGPYQESGVVGTLAGWLKPLEVLFGGLGPTRLLHHWGMWAMILFSVLHVYMVFWNALRDRTLEVESIITGYRAGGDH